MAKSKEKIGARKLRKQGKSIKEIAKHLKVSVGIVSLWCRDIQLSSKQIEVLQKRMKDSSYGRRSEYLKRIKANLDKKVSLLKSEGIKQVGILSKRDIFLTGIALYWGEGFKKDHQVGLATSDKNIARFFIHWLKICFNISTKELILRVTANISYKNKIYELEKFWSKALNISITNFSKPFFQHSIWKKEYENKDEYHGVLRIKVRRSVDLLRKIYGYIEGINLGY